MYARVLSILLVLCSVVSPPLRGQSGSPEDHYEIAAEHYKKKRWKLAAEEFASFLSRHPRHPASTAAKFFLGESLLQTGDREEAYAQYLAYLKLNDPAYASSAEFRAGETAYLLQKPEAANRHLRSYLQRFPTDRLSGYANLYLGNLAMDAGRPEEALDHYGSAIPHLTNAGFVDECRFGLAEAYRDLGRHRDARRFFTFLKDSPKYHESARLQLAVLDVEAGNAEVGKTLLESLESAQDPRVAAQAKYWAGILAARERRWTDAARRLSSLNLDDALGPSAAYTAADAHQHLGDLRSARTQLEKIVTRWPESRWGDDALRDLLELTEQGGDWQATNRLAQQFYDRYPASHLMTEVRRMHSRALLRNHRPGQAAATLLEIPLIERTGADWYHLGLAQLADDQLASALTSLGHVEPGGDRPLEASAALAVATVQMQLGQADLAEPNLRRYLELDPRGVDAQRCRAQLAIVLAQKSTGWEQAKRLHASMLADGERSESFWKTTQYLADAALSRDPSWAGDLYQLLAQGSPDDGQRAAGLAGLTWLNIHSNDGKIASDEALQQLLSEHPESPLAPKTVLAHARALRKRNQPSEALSAYDILVDKYPNAEETPNGLLESAEILDRLDRDREARAKLEQLLEAYADFADRDAALYMLAWVLDDLGESEASRQHFKELVDSYPTSRLWADSAYRLAEQAANDNELAEAETMALRILDRRGDDRATAHAHYLLGQVAAKQKRWNDVERYMQALVKGPASDELYLPARYWFAESLYRRQEYQRAGDEFQEIIELAAGRRADWMGMFPLRRAQVLAHQKRWREAYELAQTIRDDFPNFRQMYEVDYLIGRCQGSWADFHSARESYQRVLQSERAHRTETAAMAQWMIGETHLLQKNYQEAIRAYHRVVRSPRWKAAALMQAAKCHLALQEESQAKQMLDELLRDYPQSVFADDAKKRLDDLNSGGRELPRTNP